MPALTITAVDHTNDLFTCAGHGLLTGDGAGFLRNIGGALPTGSATLTAYWAIRIDANTFKIASSSANALAGTPVAISSNGTGVHLFELGIPYARARTYVAKAVDVAGAQVKSADLNSLMDSSQALHRLLTGQTQTVWTIGRKTIDVSPYTGHGAATPDIADRWVTVPDMAGNNGWRVPIPLHEGDRVVNVMVKARGSASGDLDVSLAYLKDGVATGKGSVNTVNLPGAWTAINLVIAAAELAAGETPHIIFATNGADADIDSICVTYDRALGPP